MKEDPRKRGQDKENDTELSRMRRKRPESRKKEKKGTGDRKETVNPPKLRQADGVYEVQVKMKNIQ